jgi:hypothetical protein
LDSSSIRRVTRSRVKIYVMPTSLGEDPRVLVLVGDEVPVLFVLVPVHVVREGMRGGVVAVLGF